MDIDVNSLFLILDELSYEDLYNFPMVNKYYMSLNKNSHYLHLLNRKRTELLNLYEKVHQKLTDHIISLTYGRIIAIEFYNVNSELTSIGGNMYELSTNYYRLNHLFGETDDSNDDDTHSIDMNAARSYIYDRIKNSDIINIVIFDNSIDDYMREVIDYWIKIDPDIVTNRTYHNTIEIRINSPAIVKMFMKTYS